MTTGKDMDGVLVEAVSTVEMAEALRASGAVDNLLAQIDTGSGRALRLNTVRWLTVTTPVPASTCPVQCRAKSFPTSSRSTSTSSSPRRLCSA